MTRDRLRIATIFVALMLATLAAGCGTAHASKVASKVASVCRRFAASGRPGRGRGTAAAPFTSVQRLVDALTPGQTGCLLSGTYNGDVRFSRSGRLRAPITLRSAPGSRATIVGRIYIPWGSNDIRVNRLALNGQNAANLPSPTVDSTNDQFVGDDVTNYHSAICFSLGGASDYGTARDTLIQHDRIHDCGVLPATNHEHGIYVANSVGARILDNIIVGNADRGIQLYWNAQRSIIAGNIIDHNGEGILVSGAYGYASSDNLIIDNVITDSTIRGNVGSYWDYGNPKGTGNLVINNCLHGGQGALIDFSGGGFRARGNRNLNPRYANSAAGDYALATGSPCQSVLHRAAVVASSYARRLN